MPEGVEFNEEKINSSYQGSPTPKVVKLLMRLSGGLIRSEKTAMTILLIFTLATIAIAFIILSRGGSTVEPTYYHRDNNLPGSR
ncbi:hypothetical protein HYT45_04505 [Candidatus Uhrbacteria bacterium]|nr:hypothetical protein [Candidatus Uhrbacteria bacterium]